MKKTLEELISEQSRLEAEHTALIEEKRLIDQGKKDAADDLQAAELSVKEAVTRFELAVIHHPKQAEETSARAFLDAAQGRLKEALRRSEALEAASLRLSPNHFAARISSITAQLQQVQRRAWEEVSERVTPAPTPAFLASMKRAFIASGAENFGAFCASSFHRFKPTIAEADSIRAELVEEFGLTR